MAAKPYFADPGGVFRFGKKIRVVDAGGVYRAAKKVFIADAGGVFRQVYGAGYAGSIVAGNNGYLYGYAQGSYGSISPTVDNQGNTVVVVACDYTDGEFYLTIQGAVAPPQTYFSTLNINNGALILPSTGSGVSYVASGNQGNWTWSSTRIDFLIGSSYPVVYA